MNLVLPLNSAILLQNRNKIDTKDFLPQVKIVANGYISLVGYQSQGYAFLPMD